MPRAKQDPIKVALRSSLPFLSFLSSRLGQEIKILWQGTSLKNLERRSFQISLFLAHVSVCLAAIFLAYLWHWALGFLVIWFAVVSSLLAIAFSYLSNRLRAEKISLYSYIRFVTDAAIKVQFLETEHEGRMIATPQIFCAFCGSKHPLIEKYPFHPLLHSSSCQIPVLRSKVEWIDLEIPEFNKEE